MNYKVVLITEEQQKFNMDFELDLLPDRLQCDVLADPGIICTRIFLRTPTVEDNRIVYREEDFQ